MRGERIPHLPMSQLSQMTTVQMGQRPLLRGLLRRLASYAQLIKHGLVCHPCSNDKRETRLFSNQQPKWAAPGLSCAIQPSICIMPLHKAVGQAMQSGSSSPEPHDNKKSGEFPAF